MSPKKRFEDSFVKKKPWKKNINIFKYLTSGIGNCQLLLTVFWLFFILGKFSFISSVMAENITNEKQEKVCFQDLSFQIDKILSSSARLSERWGILVQEIDNGRILYHLNSNQYFIPASNTKLFTTAGSLLKLGADFQIKTPVYLQATSEGKFNLIIEGKGDPSFKKKQLEAIVNELINKQIKQLDQVILIDDNFVSPPINYNWEYSDLFYYYAVPINSLI